MNWAISKNIKGDHRLTSKHRARTDAQPEHKKGGTALLNHGSRICRLSSTKQTFADLRKIKNAKDCLKRLPEENEAFHFLNHKEFDAWSVIPAILSLSNGQIIEQLWVSVLSFNDKNLLHMVELFDCGKIKGIHLICSLFFESLNPKQYTLAKEELGKRNQKLLPIMNHSKVLAAKLSDGRCFTLETSANLRNCSAIEHYSLTNSPELFEFYRKWHEDEFRTAKA